ncbi:hypothetical protein F2Q68_00014060 [Brassica cretica]|uniref:Uncharacterized protein n=1 Tax=Brassica cretica TaxID=69181 RepID=A0A8S9HK60_BRACR|nr:hypothetical protein F2Q68_00014060 [Brassica cretica]
MVLRERHSCVAPKTSFPAGATSCARSRRSLPCRLIHERFGLVAPKTSLAVYFSRTQTSKTRATSGCRCGDVAPYGANFHPRSRSSLPRMIL